MKRGYTKRLRDEEADDVLATLSESPTGSTKRQKNEEILKYLTKKYPKNQYRLSKRAHNVQRLFKKNWRIVCIHNDALDYCKIQACDGGKAYCIHGEIKSRCRVTGCGNGKFYCKHGKNKSICPEQDCGGGGLCEHGVRSRCKVESCGGGGSYCIHGTIRSKCLEEECGGGGSFCEHGVHRWGCKDGCGSTKAFCEHGRRKANCPEQTCAGDRLLCKKCKIKKRQKNNLCWACQPDYVPGLMFSSKASCTYLCKLSKEIGADIQHIHYDKVPKEIIGSEHTVAGWKQKKVDGYYVDLDGRKIAIEFLGDIYHGHPSLWAHKHDAKDRFGRFHRDNFDDTERKLAKLVFLGYTVKYVWENDYRKLKAADAVLPILREFNGKLKY